MKPTLSPEDLQIVLSELAEANQIFARRYPGDSPRRQPVHTVYGGAQVFRSDTAPRLGALARQSLHEHAAAPEEFGRVLGLPEPLAATIHERVLAKLEREPVEDFRIDFEDGYGNRPDAEEDGHAASTADEVAKGLDAGTLPPHVGIRIKPFSEELKLRAIRTLDIFLTRLVRATGGRLPDNFVVTLPKVTAPDQVTALASLLEQLERHLGLSERELLLEIMIETPQSVIDAAGSAALPALVTAGRGRCLAAHFGTYDYTASLNVTATYQTMTHPACDFAKGVLQVALAGTGVWISDGATNVLPVPPHRTAAGGPPLSPRQIADNRAAVHAAWRLHYEHVRHSLAGGFYQGWDLHPAQLPTRYAALYAFFLEGIDGASARLKNFVAKAGQATLVGEMFDDAATGQGLLNHFLRAWSCGAITEDEAVEKSGLTSDELRRRSFVTILKSRRS
ncbi:MAG TPA: aldolase/citrate lyase family protein [Thermoanaerobaculia bacterium]|nr:aldolase/citrate lyase family protein [Thermoanaerobaculia bacterium]